MLAQYPIFDGLPETLSGTEADVSVRYSLGADIPGYGGERVPWHPRGLYLPVRPRFTFDPRLHQGAYYVQDASSMIIGPVARALNSEGCAGDGPLRWLDACAAPGGKTTAVIDALTPGSLVVANEYDNTRRSALCVNLERWGSADTVVTGGPAQALGSLTDFFDVIAVDAPCSGEGMMRKEAVAVTQWSPSLVRQCAAAQRDIVAGVWPALRPGGYLIYSTCTFNTTENEDNLAWMTDTLGAEPVDIRALLQNTGAQDATVAVALDGVADAVTGSVPALRFIPGRIRGEGLFMAVLRKPGHASAARCTLPKRFKTATLPDWLDGKFIADATQPLTALPADNAAAMLRVAAQARTVSMGIAIGQPKGRDIEPSYALAHCRALRDGAFPQMEADLPTALRYLHGDPLQLPDAPRGYILLTYDKMPLGFVKNIGNRANNPLPTQHRIHSNIPQSLLETDSI